MAKVKFKSRFYVLIAALVGLIVVALVLFLGGKEDEITQGMMRLSHASQAVIVRDEAIRYTERYDKIVFDVVEGARVKLNDPIAQVFKWGYQEETMQALLDVQKDIFDYQLAKVEGIVNPALDAVQAQIQQKREEIRAVAAGEQSKDLLLLEKELKQLLAERTTLLRDIQPDETLTALYQRETEQTNNMASWKRDISNNVGEGVVSFYFDGYEQVLSADKLNMLSADLISGAIKGSGVMTDMDTASESPLYRLINDGHFYLAFLTNSSSPFRLVSGEVYTVVFEGYANTPYTATAKQSTLSGDKVINLLEFMQPMGELMGIRVVSATIMKDVTGLTVPIGAISMREGLPGILRVVGQDSAWVQVNVYATDEKQAIIQAVKPEEALSVGMRFRIP